MILDITSSASHHAADFTLRLANSYDPARQPADHLSELESAQALLGPYVSGGQDILLIAQNLQPFRDVLRKGLIAVAKGQASPDAEIKQALALSWRVEVQSEKNVSVRLHPEGEVARQLKAWAALGYFALLQKQQDRLRVCHSLPCEEIFRDESKPGRQRFCCKRCANRFNVARHRQRRKGGE